MAVKPVVAAFLGAAVMAATPALAQGPDTYKVKMNINTQDLYGDKKAGVYVPRDPSQIKPYPTKLDLVNVTFQSYTLLAENDKGDNIVCTGLKIDLPPNTDLSFATGSREAKAYLYPEDGTYQSKTERSYGSCRPVDVSAGYEFNNVMADVLTHRSMQAGIGFPILGSADLDSRRTVSETYNRGAYDLRGWGMPSCSAAGYKDKYAQAKKGDEIKVGFCP